MPSVIVRLVRKGGQQQRLEGYSLKGESATNYALSLVKTKTGIVGSSSKMIRNSGDWVEVEVHE